MNSNVCNLNFHHLQDIFKFSFFYFFRTFQYANFSFWTSNLGFKIENRLHLSCWRMFCLNSSLSWWQHSDVGEHFLGKLPTTNLDYQHFVYHITEIFVDSKFMRLMLDSTRNFHARHIIWMTMSATSQLVKDCFMSWLSILSNPDRWKFNFNFQIEYGKLPGMLEQGFVTVNKGGLLPLHWHKETEHYVIFR